MASPQQDENVPPAAGTKRSMTALKEPISKFLESGAMKVGEFCEALGVSGNGYRRFMAQHGKQAGMQSDTYIKAFEFFKKREVAGLKMPKKQKTAAAAGAKDKKGNAPDLSAVHLEDDEEEDKVEVYDTCDEVVAIPSSSLTITPGVTQAQFCRDLKAQYHTDKAPASIQSSQLSRFRSYKGADAGNTNCVFYAAYVYFEKLRLAEKKPKSKHREEMERIWASQGGFNVSTASSRTAMPYTPPSHQQSPASSRTTSPALSRASSYIADSPSGMRSPSSPRPALPRSLSSAAYLNKQRRGPSVTIVDPPALPQSPLESDKAGATREAERTLSSNGSIRQSPPPLNNLLIPTGAILSPPDSSENSDGDDAPDGRGRDRDRSWNELHEAVRSIELKREPSPEHANTTSSGHRDVSSEPTTSMHSPNALSHEARKISHSRSSTETAIFVPEQVAFSESPTSDDSDEEGELRMKPPLVRKKSGELVKPALRPTSRRRYSSMPGTPTYHKSVHFNDNGNQTRHFLQVDKPSAVSAGSSPVESYESETEYPFDSPTPNKVEWDFKLANFPEDTFERKSQAVRVERLYLSPDTKTLIGVVAVANISFQKAVAARFTLDYWKTTSEVSAEYDNDVRRQNMHDGYDRFSFNIRLSDQANLESKTLLLCVRYNVGGQEHWDNNNNANYQIDFVKKMAKSASTSSLSLGARPRHSIPRSKHISPVPSQDRTASTDEDIVSRFDTNSTYHFGSPEKIMGDPTNAPVKLKSRSKRADLFRAGTAPSANGLGGRYDFGASLSAALSTAQDKLGKQSGLMPHSQMARTSSANYFSRHVSKEVKSTTAGDERPESLTADRPAMGSEQYKDLVQKFCYFTPGNAGKLSPQKAPGGIDGSMDGDSSEYSSRTGSTTPTPPQSMSPMLDGTNEKRTISNNASQFSSRSASPTSIAGHSYSSRGASPLSFGYPYHQNMRDRYLSDSHAPTAIRG
ncbi:hypothetical protein MBLNU459_g7487t1 [Dothideomycetes sp. NU459]